MLRTSILRSIPRITSCASQQLPLLSATSHQRFFSALRVTMTTLKVGDKFPEGVTFSYVPYDDKKSDINACGMPQTYDASKEFANKKVVLFSVPGAFTPTCSEQHLPGYIANVEKFKAKGYDTILTIAFNDAWVMSAWGKAQGIKNNEIVFLSDPGAKFSQSIGWTAGERTARYAIAVDNGVIKYADVEKEKGVTVSSAESVLAKL